MRGVTPYSASELTSPITSSLCQGKQHYHHDFWNVLFQVSKSTLSAPVGTSPTFMFYRFPGLHLGTVLSFFWNLNRQNSKELTWVHTKCHCLHSVNFVCLVKLQFSPQVLVNGPILWAWLKEYLLNMCYETNFVWNWWVKMQGWAVSQFWEGLNR